MSYASRMARKPKPCQLPRISHKPREAYREFSPEQKARAQIRSKIERLREEQELEGSMGEVWDE